MIGQLLWLAGGVAEHTDCRVYLRQVLQTVLDVSNHDFPMVTPAVTRAAAAALAHGDVTGSPGGSE